MKIKEDYKTVSSVETAIGDSKWQKDADTSKWPSYEIYPASDWYYALVMDKNQLKENFEIVKKEWPSDNFPFTLQSVPLELKAKGKKLIGWEVDENGLCGELPIKEERVFDTKTENITLVPMGAARLRISAFPVYEE